MTPNEFITACARTNATDEKNLPASYVAYDSQYHDDGFCAKSTTVPWNVLHMAIGMCTESGEVLDAIKKSLYYDKDFDVVNIKEEVGDILWHVANIIRHYNWTFEEVFDTNIAKLKARYPNRFTTEDALNRNLEVERKLLEES